MARRTFFQFWVTQSERRQFRVAAKAAGAESDSAWARSVLLREAARIMGKVRIEVRRGDVPRLLKTLRRVGTR